MKKYLFLFTAIIIFFSACSDPIFYNISMEEKILEPRIKGSPTNFVEFNGKMYVASGKNVNIYENGGWSECDIGENVFSLATAYNHIYALCVESKLLRSENGTTWKEVPNSSKYNILTIYSANDQLFIGATNLSGDKSNHYILNGDDLSTIFAETGNSLLNGAAYDGIDYYLSVKDSKDSGGGIYRTNNLSSVNSAALIPGSDGIPFMGIIYAELTSNPVVAISRNGDLYVVNGSSVDSTKVSLGNNHLATGALAIWTDGTKKLLLAGRQDTLKSTINSGYTFGYLELDITGGELLGNFSEPGTPPTTLDTTDTNARYQSTIGKIPVNYLYQAPQHIDSKKTLFASTQKNGLWSYRDRRGMWHWNAEE